MPSAILHLDTPRELRALRRRWVFFLVPRRGPDYRFALPQVSQRANAEATALMSRYRKDCGCFAGGLFTALLLFALVVVVCRAAPAPCESAPRATSVVAEAPVFGLVTVVCRSTPACPGASTAWRWELTCAPPGAVADVVLS